MIRYLLAWFGWVGLVAALSAQTAPKPNIVVLFCDDLGYGDLGCYGHPRIRTPNLDQLAKDGLRLTHCYAASPVCSPSRAGLFTGRNPNRMGIRDWIPENSGIFLSHREPSREITLPTLLRSVGYRTALSGKWHLNSRMDGKEPTPGDHGFEYWFATQNNALPNHENPRNFIRNGQPVGELKGNSSKLIVDEALTFLSKVRKEEPFALFLTFHAPHEVVAVAEVDQADYADVTDPNQRIYHACVSLLDREIGRLLRTIDDRGQRDNTLIFFSSDNGPETLLRYKAAKHSFGSTGGLRGMKLHLTEGGIRVPGIFRWPAKIAPGQTSDEPFCGLDLLPTLCTLCGVSPPKDRFLDGADASALLLQGKPITRTTPLYWQYDRALGDYTIALREGKWKFLMDKTFQKVALYDLQADPQEKTDLADQFADVVKDLKIKALRLAKEINAGAVIRP